MGEEVLLTKEDIYYDDEGNMRSKRDGKYEGIHREFFDDYIIRCNFKNGKLHGKYMEFWDNGKPKVICTYKNGKLHRKYKRFHKNGILAGIGRYKDGEAHGKHKGFRDDGSLTMISHWKHGKLHGKFREFSIYGPFKIFNYKNGEIQKKYVPYSTPNGIKCDVYDSKKPGKFQWFLWYIGEGIRKFIRKKYYKNEESANVLKFKLEQHKAKKEAKSNQSNAVSDAKEEPKAITEKKSPVRHKIIRKGKQEQKEKGNTRE